MIGHNNKIRDLHGGLYRLSPPRRPQSRVHRRRRRRLMLIQLMQIRCVLVGCFIFWLLHDE